jgi:hypothetical protein
MFAAPIFFLLTYAALYGGVAFAVIYFAVRLAIRHERRNQ